MTKNILVPTDFSKNAWNALAFALSLYKDTPSTFYILHAFRSDNYAPDNIVMPKTAEKALEKAKAESEQGLERFLKGVGFRTENAGHRFKTISANDDLLNAVQECIEKRDIDLVVMGKKGKHDSPNIYGKNTANLMEKVKKCPVLVIPENTVLLKNSIRELVFTTNFKYSFKRRELKALVDISSRLTAPVRILYIEEEKKNFTAEQEENRQLLNDCLSEVNYTIHTLTKVSVPTGIHTFIESRDSSLLALYKRKKGFFSRLFSPSFVEDFDFNPRVPVLIMKEFN